VNVDEICLALRTKIRAESKEESTADAYCGWVRRYLKFCKERRYTKANCAAEKAVELFLSDLANTHDVTANTQNQAFSALCYLYKKVWDRPLVDVSALRAKRPETEREVLDESEIVELFSRLKGKPALVARMMYGCSFRIGEVMNLRIKDISFKRRQIVIHDGKHHQGRRVGFPPILHDQVELQIESMRVLWKYDMADGLNGVSLPYAYGRKHPAARKLFAWYYLFSADDYSRCPRSGMLLRHHQDSGHVGRQIKMAAGACGFHKHVTSHCLRHSFATHSLESGVPIHVVQKIMGHKSIETTQRYLHVAKDGITSAKSPLEGLEKVEPPLKEILSTPPAERPQLRVYAG
jgi:integron integrase